MAAVIVVLVVVVVVVVVTFNVWYRWQSIDST